MSGRFRSSVVGFVLLAVLGGAGAAESKAFYAYDAAGRLVRQADGSGRFLEFSYDAAGNPLGAKVRRLWHVAVKKPAKGAWVLRVEDDGTVSGFGADGVLGHFGIAGTLDVSGAAPTGTLDLLDPVSSATLASFPLSGGKVGRDKAGALLLLNLSGTGAAGSLKATAFRPVGAFGAFHGTFESPTNQVVEGTARSNPGRVVLFAEGTRPAVTRVFGVLGGTLVRDPKGKAYGTLEKGAETWIVAGALKDGAKAVTLKAVKGSAEALLLKVKR